MTSVAGSGDDNQTNNNRCSQQRDRVLSMLSALEGHPDIQRTVVDYPALEPGVKLKLAYEPADATFVVKRGLVKRVSWLSGATAQPTEFHCDGSLIDFSQKVGLNWEDTYIAIERSWLCRIRTRQLPASMQRRLAALLTAQVGEEHDFQLRVLALSDEQKVAAVLLRIYRHSDAPTFQLSIPDRDIARYLGLSETAVRACLRQFVVCGWIRLNRRQVTLMSPGTLDQYAEG